MDRHAGDHPAEDDQIEDDVVPEGAPRGGVTVPDANDTGMTTPPIGGWGERPVREDEEEQPSDR